MSYNNNSDKTNKKRNRPKISGVWTYFELDNNDSAVSICKICGASLPYTSVTTTMSSHLHSKHNLQKDMELNSQLVSNNIEHDSEDDVEPSNNKLTSNKKIKLDNDILDFISQTDQPISIIEHPSFLKLVSCIKF